MKPVFQSRNSQDCHRACVASILELPLGQVPSFGSLSTSGDEFHEAVRLFLHPKGIPYLQFGIADGDLDDVLTFMETVNSGYYYILGGTSSRGQRHSVVALGEELVHDPYPGGTYVKGPIRPGPDEEFPEHYAIELIGHRLTIA